MNENEKLTLGIVTLMRTFLEFYECENKIPKHIKKLLNRCTKGMVLCYKKSPADYENAIKRVNNIYTDAIEEFKKVDATIGGG